MVRLSTPLLTLSNCQNMWVLVVCTFFSWGNFPSRCIDARVSSAWGCRNIYPVGTSISTRAALLVLPSSVASHLENTERSLVDWMGDLSNFDDELIFPLLLLLLLLLLHSHTYLAQTVVVMIDLFLNWWYFSQTFSSKYFLCGCSIYPRTSTPQDASSCATACPEPFAIKLTWPQTLSSWFRRARWKLVRQW